MAPRPLILDAAAISALAHGPSTRRATVRAALVAAHRREADLVTSAAVLAELYRGPRWNPSVDGALARQAIEIVDVGRRVARIAGGALSAVGVGSEMAVDAFVVATAVDRGGAVVLTGDPVDLTRLSAGHGDVIVVGLS